MTPFAAGASRSSDTSRLRRFLAIDEREAFIERAQTSLGQLAIGLIALLAIAAHLGTWQAVLAVAAAMSAVIWTNSRAAILFSATWLMAFLEPALGGNDALERITAVVQREQLPETAALPLALGWLLLVIVEGSLLDIVKECSRCVHGRLLLDIVGGLVDDSSKVHRRGLLLDKRGVRQFRVGADGGLEVLGRRLAHSTEEVDCRDHGLVEGDTGVQHDAEPAFSGSPVVGEHRDRERARDRHSDGLLDAG